MLRIALLLALLVPVACGGGKKKGPETAEVSAAKELPKDIPDDDKSRAFAERLMKHDAKNFTPTDAPGPRFVYQTMTFQPDMSWQADARVIAEGETFDCRELGSWTMDPAETEHTANMSWQMNKSTCPGRPEKAAMRVRVTIEKGEYKVEMR